MWDPHLWTWIPGGEEDIYTDKTHASEVKRKLRRWDGQGQIFWVASRKHFNQKYWISLRIASMFRIVGSGGKIVAGLHLFTSVSAYHSPRLTFCSCSPSSRTTVSLGVGSIKQFPAFLCSKNIGKGGIVFNYLLIIILIILIIHLHILISSPVCLSSPAVFISTATG